MYKNKKAILKRNKLVYAKAISNTTNEDIRYLNQGF